MASYLIKDMIHVEYPLKGRKYLFDQAYVENVGCIAEFTAENDPKKIRYGTPLVYTKFRDGEMPSLITLKDTIAVEDYEGGLKVTLVNDMALILEPVTKKTRTFYATDPMAELKPRR